MQSSRLFEIIYILMDKHFATCEELARELEVSVRTIRRDVDALSAFGVPVYMTRGKGGGVHLMPHYVLDKSLVSAQDQTEILAALSALRSTGAIGDMGDAGDGGGRFSSKSKSDKPGKTNSLAGQNNALERLTRIFQREAIDWLDIDLSFWGAPPEFKRAFEIIKEAIISRHLLTFGYFDANGKPTQRSVEPTKLVFKESSWYMRAYCLKRNDWRTFKLFRMDVDNMQILAQPFEPRIDTGVVDFAEYPKSETKLKLKFKAGAEFRVREEFPPDWIVFQDDGSMIVEEEVTLDLRTYSYLLSFGSDLEVLEPQSMRDSLADKAREILDIYEICPT